MPHIHDTIDITVETFIVHGNKVFLRMHDKYGIWLTPGGHVELDEDPTEAAVREAKEEAGLDIVLRGTVPEFKALKGDARAIMPPRHMMRHHVNDTHEHVVMIYYAISESDTVTAGGHDRSDEWRWFTAEDLDDPQYELNEEVRFYAHEALRELGTIA